jgi:aquaporin Z
MIQALRDRWREYLIEATGLGIFMVAAGVVATLIESPDLPVRELIAEPIWRRLLIGIAMGLTAIAIIYSPWGKRSGAHINPAVTLTFFRLGKLAPWDAFFYVLAQFIGGVTGVVLVAYIFKNLFTNPPVNYVVTVPGSGGWISAFLAEFVLAFGLMLMVLFTSNHRKLERFTVLFAGLMVATYITLEAPISGMSINPARTFASAFPSGIWTAFWIYYFAPPLAMLLAAEVYLRYFKRPKILCGKLCPNSETPCLCVRCCCQEEMWGESLKSKV